MTIRVSLSPSAEARLRARASESGQDVAAVASELLEQAVAGPTVDEVLAPFRKQVSERGISDTELDDFLRTELEAHRREKREKSA